LINLKLSTTICNAGVYIPVQLIITISKIQHYAIYSLARNSYTTLESDLLFVLFNLAKSHTGIPLKYLEGYKLEDDAVKAIADMLPHDVIHQMRKISRYLHRRMAINFRKSGPFICPIKLKVIFKF
jgi:hypothetical protein